MILALRHRRTHFYHRPRLQDRRPISPLSFSPAPRAFSSKWTKYNQIRRCLHPITPITPPFRDRGWRMLSASSDTQLKKLGLNERSLVVEVASNDGYLLQYMAERRIPCVGIEPTKGTADAARAKGIDTVCEFFGDAFAQRFARERGSAHLIVANNVLAHVPDLHDFVAGLASVLAPNGVISVEFPHLQRLVAERQFDTIYHEHFSYFSLHTVHRAFAAHGLRIWDVEHLSTHGGSLRIWASHMDGGHAYSPSVAATLSDEANAGMLDMSYYRGFQIQANTVKNELLEFLLKQRRRGRKVAAYGAAAKGNTLLNYAGVKPDLIPMVADSSPHKQGRFMPGSRISIVNEAALRDFKPDFVIVLPWNLLTEISSQLEYIRNWGGRFVTVIPKLTLL